MNKVLLITDLHITREGRDIIGLDPVARLTKVLDAARREQPDADLLIAMGDLTHWGGANEYARLKPLLDDLPWPVHLMIGNHDNRAQFVKAFPEAPRTEAGHIQQVIDLGGWRLILLDSHDESFSMPIHSGVLCDARMAWLERALEEACDRQVLICIHHPPLRTFFDGMDAIGLRNQEALLALLSRYPNVRQIVAGHIHRTISGTSGALPVSIFKGTCHQMPLALGASSADDSVDEPGVYGLVLLHESGLTIHSQDVF